MGPKVDGFKPRKPQSREFAKLVNYRTYRIKPTQAMSLAKRTKVTNKALKFFNVKKVMCFTGKKPLEVFEFLATFVVTAEKVPIGEMEAMDILLDFLDGPGKSSMLTAQRTASTKGEEFI